IFCKGFILFFGILGIDPRGPSGLLDRCFECFWSDSSFLQCLFQNWIFYKCCNKMILCNIGILLSFLYCLSRTKQLEGCRAQRYLLWRRVLKYKVSTISTREYIYL